MHGSRRARKTSGKGKLAKKLRLMIFPIETESGIAPRIWLTARQGSVPRSKGQAGTVNSFN